MAASCFSNLSRNRYVGESRWGGGKPLAEVLASMVHVAEGVDTIKAALVLAKRHDMEMPITEVTARILFDGVGPPRGDVVAAEPRSRPGVAVRAPLAAN